MGVIPDLSTYAKALANGYPLSAYGGRRDVMETLPETDGCVGLAALAVVEAMGASAGVGGTRQLVRYGV